MAKKAGLTHRNKGPLSTAGLRSLELFSQIRLAHFGIGCQIRGSSLLQLPDIV
ncbi:MAG TPA: hypothetical protein VN652_08415 [Geobacteraceae bacterium]|nr:hypothetical protein [Geobacteraceae bacterium]